MKSCAKRRISAVERPLFPKIAGQFRIASPPAVLEAGTRLGKRGGSSIAGGKAQRMNSPSCRGRNRRRNLDMMWRT